MLGKYVIDKELKNKGIERLGYVMEWNDDMKAYGVSFRDEPYAVYWMQEKQLEVVDSAHNERMDGR